MARVEAEALSGEKPRKVNCLLAEAVARHTEIETNSLDFPVGRISESHLPGSLASRTQFVGNSRKGTGPGAVWSSPPGIAELWPKPPAKPLAQESPERVVRAGWVDKPECG